MGTYVRVQEEEREEISRLLARGESQQSIARQIGRHPSTVSREIGKGGCNRYTYRGGRAQRRAQRNATKRKAGKYKIMENSCLQEYIHAKLRLRWSPDQIVQELGKDYAEDPKMQVSSETIYAYLYVLPKGVLRKELLSCLRRAHKRRHARGGKTPVVERRIEDMLSIEERPLAVMDRTIPGHWEGDLLVGRNRQSVLGTLVERTTRTTLLVPLKSKQAEEVAKTFAQEIQQLPRQMRLTLTYDQGREMAAHKLFTQMTGVKVYFAHPRSPWERGTNENTNGLVRQFFPKGTDFHKLSRKEVKRVQHLLNGRPRKTLHWLTPYQAFQKYLDSLR